MNVPTQTPAGPARSPQRVAVTSVRCLAALLAWLVAGSALAGEPQPAGAVRYAGETQLRVPDCEGERPISDFLEAQGTFDVGGLLLPPVPNFVAWTDPVSKLGLSIDYAGLADEACGGVARTRFTGRVCERPMFDGRYEVTVDLYTLGAITWVVDGFEFARDPVIFGVRWRQNDEGSCGLHGSLALGTSMLQVRFINTGAGAALPDLLQLVVAPERGQELTGLSLHAEATGELADGTPARAAAHQVLALNSRGELEFVVENVVVGKLP